jgi:hypothetical protein
MEKAIRNKSGDPSIALTDVADLLKKQPVRATFKVSPEFIEMFRYRKGGCQRQADHGTAGGEISIVPLPLDHVRYTDQRRWFV